MDVFSLGSQTLTLDTVIDIAHGRQSLELCPNACQNIGRIRSKIEALLNPAAPDVYGVNTGFGALAEVRVPMEDLATLQLNLIRSHSTGIGRPFDRSTTRAIMLLRANVLMLGTSGVRPCIPELLVNMLNTGVHPVIPEKGSVGASGDLAPLAHLALVLVGEGQAEYQGSILPGREALKRAGLAPIVLAPKEGLALINGTQAMTADGALVIERMRNILRVADIVGAASIQALLGSRGPFDERIHAMRAHPGQIHSARNMRTLLKDSEIIFSHRDCSKVQDPYSLRCIAQVHGASRDALTHVSDIVNRECHAATDNPLVFADERGDIELISGGNFHGQPIALAMDYLGIAISEIGNISERRIEQLVNPALSSGLPAFLAPNSGLNSGFMIAQVTAAALASENKGLAHPASVDSIPSSANREDHVSMGTIAARKARHIAEHVEYILAIELLCACQAMSLRRPLKASPPIEAAIHLLRQSVPEMTEDRYLQPDIEASLHLIQSGILADTVEAVLTS